MKLNVLYTGAAVAMAAFLAGCSDAPCTAFREAQVKEGEASPGCRRVKDYQGTPQALVTSQSPWVEAQRTRRQSFDCSGTPVVVYTFDFGSESQAQSKAALLRTSLWTGPAPDASHTDELLVKGRVVVLVSSPDPSPLATVLEAKGFAPYRS